MFLCNVLCSVLVVNVLITECSNIFHERSKIVYRPDDASEYFGFSVVLSNKRLLVGAPKARSRLNRAISSGQVFKCPVQDLDTSHVTCVPIGVAHEKEDRYFAKSFQHNRDLLKEDMWFGATLSTSPNGDVLICAPRWTGHDYEDSLLGMCYMLSSRKGTPYKPLDNSDLRYFTVDIVRREYKEIGKTFFYYAVGQVGFSVKLSNNSVILGAPGLVDWTGGVVKYGMLYNNDYSYLSRQIPTNSYYTKELGPSDYLGYSVETGEFEKNGETLIVAGAPRSHSGYGQVLIYEPSTKETEPLNIKFKVVGNQRYSYFGATLCCTDVNGDGVVDLLVGAPNYARKVGMLHYDQGVVFIYLTKRQLHNQTLDILEYLYDSNELKLDEGSKFSLKKANYVSGSEKSGARFGSSIADLGDINGDGFNDIAIGAPWEDEGKGAVYIYRGGKKGLNKQYMQRIAVAESKTFGYAISKGVDIDGNNCNDLAVGAYKINTAYLYRCVPTVHVTVSIKVPNAVNLPVNTTNFTSSFCVKSTQRTLIKGKAKSKWLMKADFKAKIEIDTKGNRATLKGDTEYDLSITAGKTKCDPKTVVLKRTADLSRPISIKFNLEYKESFKDDKKFPIYGARLSADSVLKTSFDIQLRKDCGEDLICKPWLEMLLEPLRSTFVPGTDDRLGFKVSVINREEPSYGAKVHLTLPSLPIRLPSECSLEELILSCSLPAPLLRSKSVEWEIELENTYRDNVEHELKVVALLEDQFNDVTDLERKRKDIVILIKPKAKFNISGKALQNATVAISRNRFDEAGNVTFTHYYEVTNFGPSDWFHLSIQVLLPERVNLSSQIKGCLELGPQLECTWNLPAQVSLPIVLPLRFDLGLHGEFLDEQNKFNVTTTVVIEGQNKSASITTTLILEPAPPIWPYIVGGIAGLLLLSVMILILHKYGFFSRKRPENFKRLEEHEKVDEAGTSGRDLEDNGSADKAENATTCNGDEEPSKVNKNSSQELLVNL